MLGLRGALGEMPTLAWQEAEFVGATTGFYFSDRGFITRSTDTPASTPFLAKALSPGDIQRTMPILPVADRRVSIDIGIVTLLNEDGSLDDMVRRFAIDGRRVVIKVGH